MADLKISALTASTTPLAGTEVLPIVQSSTTKQVSIANVTAGRAVSAASVAVTGSTAPANGAYLPAANTLGLATNSATAVYIDSSQRVLLGTTAVINYGGSASLAKQQSVVTNASTNAVLPTAAFITRSSGTPAAGIGSQIDLCADNAYSSVSPYGSIGGVATDLSNISGDLVFYSMLNNVSAEKWRINSTGNLVVKNSGNGIDFSATAGTGTSELLSDYEEGTWSPIYQTTGGSFTYDIQTGTYTKIGNVVYCSFRISTATVTAGTGNVLLAGLPFTQNSSSNVRGSFGIGDSRSFLGDTPTGIVTEETGTTTAKLTYRLLANGGVTNLDASDLAPTGAFQNIIAGSFFYTV